MAALNTTVGPIMMVEFTILMYTALVVLESVGMKTNANGTLLEVYISFWMERNGTPNTSSQTGLEMGELMKEAL
jgi:hypothetical protein